MLPLDFARSLRENATPAERALWRILSRLRPRFTRQRRIHPYTADFACRRARLVVELDGSQHADGRKDAMRTAALGKHGWAVVRFWNNDVLNNTEGVAEAIIAAATPRLPPGEEFVSVNPRPARKRKNKEPPPTPPANAGEEL